MSRDVRVLRGAAHPQDAEGLRGAVRLQGQDGLHQDVQEHLGVSAEGVLLILVWPAVAEAALFY